MNKLTNGLIVLVVGNNSCGLKSKLFYPAADRF